MRGFFWLRMGKLNFVHNLFTLHSNNIDIILLSIENHEKIQWKTIARRNLDDRNPKCYQTIWKKGRSQPGEFYDK